MRKVLTNLIIVMVIIIILATSFFVWWYLEIQENKRIDAEAVTLKEDLTVEFGEKVRVSDFLANLNGTLLNDHDINTEQLGEITVTFDFINIKNKKRTAQFKINIIDVTKPKIFSGASYTVTTGYNKDLTQVLLSGDDIDDNPIRKIEGQYDFNVAGDYNLTYIVRDSSGNETKKDFILHVVEPIEPSEQLEPPAVVEPIYFDDIFQEHKNDKTKIGIDVSKWQGEINWEDVKNAGVEFAIIRVGYQTDYDGEYVVDPYFISNIEGAKAQGIPVGVYFYSYAKTVEQAVEQAEWVKEQINGYEIDLPITFDWESWNSFNKTGMSFYKINKVANTFLLSLEQAGYKGMLYSSKNYLEKIWYPTEYDVWLAHYTSKTNYQGKYHIWQRCDTGRVNGINGNVDINVMYLNK